MAGSLSAAERARAADVSGVTSVSISDPVDEITVYENFRITAEWAFAADAVAGDSFTLTLPTAPRVEGIASSFEVFDPAGAVVATCTVHAGSVVCIASDYVNTHADVRGSLSFWAEAQQPTTDAALFFSTPDGLVLSAPVPGGAIRPEAAYAPFTETHVDGILSTDGTAGWTIFLSSQELAQGAVITSSLSPGLVLDPSTIALVSFPVATWNDGQPTVQIDLHEGLDYDMVPGRDPSTFSIVMTSAPASDAVYRVRFQAAFPTWARDGDAFSVAVSGSGLTPAAGTVLFSGGGGEAQSLAAHSGPVARDSAAEPSFRRSAQGTEHGASAALTPEIPQSLPTEADRMAASISRSEVSPTEALPEPSGSLLMNPAAVAPWGVVGGVLLVLFGVVQGGAVARRLLVRR
ncbi:Ig-like domain-containing protein [Zhihengliuella sp. ISTPL4]|uniref:Ig-like domain-containing protein n=1 Tax=Zhihengliuella sp. ISTPL4 TaxID=2058657 RepID=UPI0013054655|nr:Ig-like domain-containing protein [Zhihengliuella sp. ISTPL4]